MLEAAAFVASVGLAPVSWPRIAFAVTSVTILFFAVFTGRRTPFTRFEGCALVAAVGGGVVWLAWETPVATLLVSAAVAAIAYATTIKKLAAHPGSEDGLSWSLTATAGVLNVVVLTTFSPAVVLPLAVTIVGSVTISVMLFVNWRRSRCVSHPAIEGTSLNETGPDPAW
ncbi:hypothetical protein [Microbacterium gorillae]|uniref:hypothetical protein n=1 Tax=Microbacterium gorillae TaxID=1231063 RepID=UPI003D97257E